MLAFALLSVAGWGEPPTATGTVTAHVPIASIGDASVAEGDAGKANAVFTVTLSEPSASTVTVSYITRAGSASSAIDFIHRNRVLTFSPGKTTAKASVQIIGDVEVEPDEDFFVDLAFANGAALRRFTGTATIRNDEGAAGLSVGDVTVIEGNAGRTNAIFNVRLPAPLQHDVTAAYATSNGSATAPADYVAKSRSLTIPAGKVSTSITVNVKADGVIEGDESFGVTLTSAAGAVIQDGQGIATIIDDDSAPDPPDAPTLSVQRAPQAGVVDTAWTEPSANGSPITSYGVEISFNGGATWYLVRRVQPPARTASFYCGSPSVTCHFRVFAESAAGIGLHSNIGFATTWGAPAAPSLAVYPTQSPGELKLYWDRPETDGLPVTSFTIHISRDGGVEWFHLAVTHDLTYAHQCSYAAGVTCHYRVYAQNDAGVSPWSNVAWGTT